MIRVGRIPYINCYPVYGAVDRGLVSLDAELVTGTPTELNSLSAANALDVSVVSAVEYARASSRYLLLPDLAISCDGPVRSVMLFSRLPVESLGGRRVLLSRSSMTSAALLRLLFSEVWCVEPEYTAGDAEVSDLARFEQEEHDARLVIGDAALLLCAPGSGIGQARVTPSYQYVYDLGAEWKAWTGLPFVFAVWVARRAVAVRDALGVHARLIESRDWGLAHLPLLAAQAAQTTGLDRCSCETFLSGLDYRLSWSHLAGLTDFFRRLARAGEVPDGSLAFLPAA